MARPGRATQLQELQLKCAQQQETIKNIKDAIQLAEKYKLQVSQLQQVRSESEEKLERAKEEIQRLTQQLQDLTKEITRPTAKEEVRMAQLIAKRSVEIEESFHKDIEKLARENREKDEVIDAMRDTIGYFTTALTQISVRLTTLVSLKVPPTHAEVTRSNGLVQSVMEDLFGLFYTKPRTLTESPLLAATTVTESPLLAATTVTESPLIAATTEEVYQPIQEIHPN